MFLIYFIYYTEKEVNLYLSNFNDFFYSPISAVADHTVADHIEVVRTEVVRIEVARIEVVRIEVVRIEVVRTAIARTEVVRTEVVRTEVVRTVAGFVVFESAAAGYLQGHLKYMT